MVIFHSYVKLPEGKLRYVTTPHSITSITITDCAGKDVVCLEEMCHDHVQWHQPGQLHPSVANISQHMAFDFLMSV